MVNEGFFLGVLKHLDIMGCNVTYKRYVGCVLHTRIMTSGFQSLAIAIKRIRSLDTPF